MTLTGPFTDDILEADILAFQNALRDWAIGHDIWFDCGFTSYLEHVDGEPSEIAPVVCIQYYSSDFEMALHGDLEGEFTKLVSSYGFFYELSGTANIQYYPEEGARCDAYAAYFRWQWICSLVQPDFADVYEELYAHFAKRPEDMNRLHWRDYEILLARIFQTQGFAVQLGPGQGDGGVDITLLQRDPIGDLLTLVQAKKYAPKNRIGLEAVAALAGVAGVENAHHSIFVTTSSYQPAARKFAARTGGKLDLRTSADVAEWCHVAQDGIIVDKSSLVAPTAVERLLLELRQRPDRRVVHATWGWNMIHNDFAVVIKEAKNAALLMRLQNQNVTDDGYGQRGTEVPLFDASATSNLRRDRVFRAKRKVDEFNRVSFWDGERLFTPWDGSPALYDYCD